MMTNFTLKLMLGFFLLMALPSCQSFNGLPEVLAVPTAPPLSGPRASVLGDSALAFQQNSSYYDVNLVPISAGTGRIVAGYQPLNIGDSYQYAFSQNREQIAIVSLGSKDCQSICLHLINLRTWKYSMPPINLSKDASAFYSNLVFDATGNKLAMVYNNGNNLNQIVLLDLVQGKIIARANVNYSPNIEAFTPGGSLAVWGVVNQSSTNSIGQVALLDGNTLSVQWQRELPEVNYGNDLAELNGDPTAGRFLSPATAFSPDSSKLYVMLADEPRLLTINFSQRTVNSSTIEPPRSLIERLMDSTAGLVYAKALNGTVKSGVLSADGSYFFVVGQTWHAVKDNSGNWTAAQSPLGLQVIDVNSGTQVLNLATAATDLQLSPDGTLLFLHSWKPYNDIISMPFTEVLDVKKLAIVNRLPGQYQPTRLLDGKIAWLYENPQPDNSDHLAIYMPGASQPLSQWSERYTDVMYWLEVP
jgi:hypothetical protein